MFQTRGKAPESRTRLIFFKTFRQSQCGWSVVRGEGGIEKIGSIGEEM